MTYPIKSYRPITPTKNNRGEFDRGFAWWKYKSGYTDIFGNSIPQFNPKDFCFVKAGEQDGEN